MSQSIEGLENLIMIPTGCGEQTMMTFTPNIFVREYLTTVNQLSSEIRINTEKYMKIGELCFMHYRYKKYYHYAVKRERRS